MQTHPTMRDVGRQEIFFFCSNEFGFGRLSADAHHPCEVLTSLTLCSANPAMHALPSFLLQTDLSMAAAAQLSHPGSRGQELHKHSLFLPVQS